MEPIGHIAGIGAAINGFTSTIMAVPIATCIGAYITNTALPLFVGFFICGIISLLLIGFLYFTNKNPLVSVFHKVPRPINKGIFLW